MNTCNTTEQQHKPAKYVKVQHIPQSQLPYRLIRKRDGLILGSFPTEEAARDWITRLKPSTYLPKSLLN